LLSKILADRFFRIENAEHSSAVAAFGGSRLEGAPLDGVTRCCPNFLDNHDLLKGYRLGTGILLSKSARGLVSKVQRQLLVVDAVQSRRSLEGIVQPSHQVT